VSEPAKAVAPAKTVAHGGTGANGPRRRWWPLALAFVVGAAFATGGLKLLQQPPPPTDTRFINFEPDSTDNAVLATGWGSFEHNDQGESWAWCTATSCTLFFDAHGKRDRVIRLRTWTFRFPNSPPQTVVATLNGNEAGTAELEGPPVIWEIAAPKGAWKDGKNVLRFDFGYAEAPANHVPGSVDTRTLSVAFDWLEIVTR
jgi:hypothetical protein